MSLQEVLKKESIGEEELKILSANMHLLSREDKIRFGFETAEEAETLEEVEELDSPLAKYKVIGVIPILDEEGNENGFLEEGSIQEVPELLGDSWVEEGIAEKVLEEEAKVEVEKPKYATKGAVEKKGMGKLTAHVYLDHLEENGLITREQNTNTIVSGVKMGHFIGYKGQFYKIVDDGYSQISNEFSWAGDRRFFITIEAIEVDEEIFQGR